MKLFKYIIPSSLLSFACLFGMGLDDLGKQPEDRMKLSQLGEEYWEDSEEDDVWIVFVKQLGDEKFLVRFPKAPEDEYFQKNANEEAFRYHSSEEEAEYTLHAMQNHSDPGYLSSHLEKIRSSGYHILKEEKLEQTEQGWILDLVYEDSLISGDGTKTIFKERILVSEKNTYHILTKYTEGKEDRHEDFIESFEIVLPFPGRP